MYSHGSSARAGVGKQGHGGREYRPPKGRRNKDDHDDDAATRTLIPPPLKGCNCLLQIDIPEYMVEGEIIQPSSSSSSSSSSQDAPVAANDVASYPSQSQGSHQRRRLHRCFSGPTLEERRKTVQVCEQFVRSRFGCHLVIPGRNAKGPVGIAGKTYRDTVPAMAYFLQQLNLSSDNAQELTWNGRIQRNVKNTQDITLEGIWSTQVLVDEGASTFPGNQLLPYWLFRNEIWSVMACNVLCNESDPTLDNEKEHSMSLSTVLQVLETCLENLRFRIGNTEIEKIDIFFQQKVAKNVKKNRTTSQASNKSFATAFAAGPPNLVTVLFHEIAQLKIQ